MIVLLPYLDLPHVALQEENAIAFLTMKGDRGWMNKKDAQDYFENVHYDHHEAVQMGSLFYSAGWEAIPVAWLCIDWEKHFRIRNDDNGFDVSSDSFWKQSQLIHCCDWCGHANLKSNWVKNSVCEACDWDPSKDDGKRQDYANFQIPVVEFDESKGIDLGVDWE